MEYNSPEIVKIIGDSEKIAISAHTSPDGDAIGSCTAFALVLEMLGKKPVIFLEKYNKKFEYLKGIKFITQDIPEDKEFDLFISLDCGSKDRLAAFEEIFDSAVTTISIDHHISNTNFAHYNIVYPDASSTCEVVYEIIKNFCMITKDIAECLYTGIITDTGGFMHSCTLPRTHEIAAELLKLGISTPDLHTILMHTHTFNEMKVCGYAYSKAVMEGNICWCEITNDEIINKCGSNHDEIDTIVSYLVNCEGAKASVFVYEKLDGSVKASLRSKGLDISKICVKYGGGGHVCAAGVNFWGKTVEEVRKIIVSEVKEALKNE